MGWLKLHDSRIRTDQIVFLSGLEFGRTGNPVAYAFLRHGTKIQVDLEDHTTILAAIDAEIDRDFELGGLLDGEAPASIPNDFTVRGAQEGGQ